MSDGPALLAAVLASPGEDTPRLVYADYLQETGDPFWAEFIRTHIRLTDLRTRGGLADDIRGAERLAARVRALSRKVYFSKRFPFPVVECLAWANAGRATQAVRLRRGFVEEVRLQSYMWARHAPAILSRWPVRVAYFSDPIDPRCERVPLIKDIPHADRPGVAFDYFRG